MDLLVAEGGDVAIALQALLVEVHGEGDVNGDHEFKVDAGLCRGGHRKAGERGKGGQRKEDEPPNKVRRASYGFFSKGACLVIHRAQSLFNQFWRRKLYQLLVWSCLKVRFVQ